MRWLGLNSSNLFFALLLLACVGSHVFMMFGMHGRKGHEHDDGRDGATGGHGEGSHAGHGGCCGTPSAAPQKSDDPDTSPKAG